MNNGFFITGTDTEVGKTYVSCALLRAFSQQGKRVAAMKPVASDCKIGPQGLRNDDALQLIDNSDLQLPYEIVNPYHFEPAIAPHIAAAQANIKINLPGLKHTFQQIEKQADLTLVEGAGGWWVPLDDDHTLADLAVALALPVILVVGIRLGCINHSLLSAAAIRASGLTLAGWVANRIDPDCAFIDENILAINQRIGAPCLGDLPYAPQLNANQRVEFMDVSTLL